MAGTKREYSKDFKQEAVRLYESSGKSQRQLESELGITPGLLNKWRMQATAQGEQAFPEGAGRAWITCSRKAEAGILKSYVFI